MNWSGLLGGIRRSGLFFSSLLYTCIVYAGGNHLQKPDSLGTDMYFFHSIILISTYILITSNFLIAMNSISIFYCKYNNN